MAKLECKLQGDFDQILHELDDVIMESISATLEEYSDFEIGNCRCAIRVYERYSFIGGNRVSLSITLLQEGEVLLLSAITSGGSAAAFFKLNTMGENAFLDKIGDVIDKYSVVKSTW